MLSESYYETIANIPNLPIRYVVSVSSGASSAVAAERVLQRYGSENVDLVFADTKHEHEDNYRFLSDLEARWGKAIIRFADGRTPEQVWDDRQIIPNDMLAPCTYELKLKLIVDYVQSLRKHGYMVVMCVGYSLKDTRRRSKMANQYPKWMVDRYPGRLLATVVNWSTAGNAIVEFPCLWKPIDLDVLETVKSWGIKLPAMYALGFTSANCNGDCPKGGSAHWRRVLTHYPEIYQRRESWEREKRKHSKFADYTILTRDRGGETVNLTLEDLRLETEGKDSRQMRLFAMSDDMDSTCTTGECGIGWDDIAVKAG